MFGKAEFVRTHKALTAFSAVAAIALALGGCDDIAAQHAVPVRPVLVTSVHYEAQAPQRSFVGTVRPRIETDMGFRVGGKVSKRLVEVGAMVDTGQPLATLDEVDLKLQAEQADAEFSAATGVLAQASAAEARAKELRQKGWSTDAQLEQAKAAADEARARTQTRRTIGRPDEEQPLLRNAGRRRARRCHINIDRARSGGRRRSDCDPRCAASRERGRGRDP